MSLPVGPFLFQGVPFPSKGSLPLQGGSCIFMGVTAASRGPCKFQESLLL